MTASPLCWMIEHLGRRGMVLAVIGLIWLFYGLSMFLAGPTPIVADTSVWHLRLDPDLRGALWAGTGILAVYTAFSRPQTDTPGFLALSLGPVMHVASYFTAWVVWALPLDETGYAQGLVTGLAWLAVLTLIAVVASWPEPQACDSCPVKRAIFPPNLGGGERE